MKKIDDERDLQFGSFKNNPKNVIEKLNEKYKHKLEDDDIKQMINNFGELAKEMYKEYDYNIDKLRTFIECIKDEISEVIVYGLAIKPEFMDKAYFENYLFGKFKNTQWILYYKDHDSKDNQTAYMSNISFVKPFKQLPMKDNGS